MQWYAGSPQLAGMVTISKKNKKLVLPKEYEADTKVNIQVPPSFQPTSLTALRKEH
jgi:hypothetical protein